MPSVAFPIPFKDPRHEMLVKAVCNRKKFSEEHMSKYYTRWQDNEDRFVAHIPETALDAKRRTARDVEGKPKFTTVKIPMSYAMLMTAHTYWTSIFLGRDPVFQFMGRHGESEGSVNAVNALLDYQVRVGQHMVPYHIWLLDPGRYSFGVLWNFWAEETQTVSQIVEQPIGGDAFAAMRGDRQQTERIRIVTQMPGYRGNRVFNVQPWDFLNDPRVPLWDFQRGEFCGRKTRVGWNYILKMEASGLYFNTEELRRSLKAQNTGGSDATDSHTPGSEHVERPTLLDPVSVDEKMGEKGFVSIVEMVIEFVPKHWKLGQSTSPERWVLTVGEDKVLIGLQPLGAYHNRFPCSILEYEPEGYGLIGQSLIERADQLNHVLDWLVNTHFFNVRQALANQFIYDPSRLEEEDVLDTEPGKMIRLKPEAYGQDIRTMFQQLQVGDVTQNHLRDAQFVNEILQKIVGVTDNVMGSVNPGGRKTATEVRTASSFSVNRLKTAAEFFSASGFEPLSQMMLQNTQQYYDQQQTFRIAGDMINAKSPFINVGPDSIQGFYDFVPIDGSAPMDKFAMANLWRQLMIDMAGIGLAQQYNFGGLFEWVAQMAGMKGIKQFRMQAVPDDELAQQAAAGNVVPIGGGNGGRGAIPSATPGGDSAGLGRIPEPGQIPGLGTTG